MILQELIKETDCLQMASIWQSWQPDYEKPYDLEALSARLEDFVKMQLGLKAIPSKADVLLATTVYGDGEAMLDIPVYNIDELQQAASQCKSVQISSVDASMTTAELDKICVELTPYLSVSSYAYEFMEWEEVLGYQVLPFNVERVGIQRYLATVLWNMSFNGYTKDKQDERRKELEDALKEAENGIAEAMTLEELFGPDTRTQEEKDEDKHRWALDHAMSVIAKLKEFQTIAEEMKEKEK